MDYLENAGLEGDGGLTRLLQSREESEVRRLIEEVVKLKEDMRWNKVRLQRELGVSAPNLHQWLRGDILRTDAVIFARAKAVLKKYREASIGYLPLEVSETCQEVFNRTLDSAEIALLIGAHGTGRSFAASRQLLSKNAHNSVLFSPLSGLSDMTVLRMLAEATGDWISGHSLDEIKSQLTDRLRNTTKLIMVDDAEKLSDSSLTAIAEIVERTKSALVLIGSQELLKRVDSRHLRWVREHITEWCRLPDCLCDEEVALIVEKFFEQKMAPAIVRTAAELSGKNLKRLVQILRIVRRAGLESDAISATMLHNAASRLLPRKAEPKAPATLEKFKQPVPVLDEAASAG